MIQTIPDDTVCCIFAAFSSALVMDQKDFPWFLGHICSGWRSVFLSMVLEFWSRIEIYNRNPIPSERACVSRASMIKFFLQRNARVPFSFIFQSFRPAATTTEEYEEMHFRLVLNMLIDESPRWKEADFTILPIDLLSLSRVQGRLPQLQKLSLYLSMGPSGVGPEMQLFQSAPSLTHIDIANLSSWNFNWSNLKVVILRSTGPTNTFLSALRQMINLERLILLSSPRNPTLSTMILFPRLEYLEIPPNLLHSLKAPALEHLHLHFTGFLKDQSRHAVTSFLSRSSCHILRLGMIGCEPEAAIQIIQHTPQIVHLELGGMENVSSVLKELTFSSHPEGELLASHLQSLELALYKADMDEIDLLSDLILLRTSVGDDLGFEKVQSLTISGHGFRTVPDTICQLNVLCKERGVQIIDRTW
ncbi:hypothetical protein AX15_001631 [Amanita polypyramis BW_CC]|nr:hypothetical protein AX15_001631 [Amanita polypyramis BW_CC]